MKKTIWLSYDLGVRGDYDALYAYLDNQGAVECGDGVAFFSVEFSGEDRDLEDKIKGEIDAAVRLSKTDRIYLIYRKADHRVGGKFIFGKRKASPWQGFGERVESEDDGL